MSQFTGTVRWFNNAKGYGFLGRNDGGPDVFAHYTSIHRDGYKTLKEGEPVSFDIIQSEKGPQADNVLPLSSIRLSADPGAAHPPQSVSAPPHIQLRHA
jgi:CspA family cold shock protein